MWDVPHAAMRGECPTEQLVTLFGSWLAVP